MNLQKLSLCAAVTLISVLPILITASSTRKPIPTRPPADEPCTNLTGYWYSETPRPTQLCINVDWDGSVYALIRNGTEPYFVFSRGLADYTYGFKHIGLTAIGPPFPNVIAGYTGECHRCRGREVLLMTSEERSKGRSSECGQGSKVKVENSYKFRRTGECGWFPWPRTAVDRQSEEHIRYNGIPKENVIITVHEKLIH